MKIAIYNESCVMAGRAVSDTDLEQAVADNSGRDCDPWEGDNWTIYGGTAEELLAEAARLPYHRGRGYDNYYQRVAETIRTAVYDARPDLEPEEDEEDGEEA